MTVGVDTAVPNRSTIGQILELVATAVALAAAVAAGAGLFALSATGRWKFRDLLLNAGVPAAAVLLAILVVASVMRWKRLSRAISLGFVSGVIATVGLEIIRTVGFRVFHSMPGDLPTLMGVQAAGRIMVGPNVSSTLVGYLDHFWNGGMFGIVFAVFLGGFPATRHRWPGAVLGALYGIALGFGFATGPVPRSLGVGGVFSTVTVVEFQTTVYLAHLVFGLILGVLVHRFGANITPLWIPILGLLRSGGSHREDDPLGRQHTQDPPKGP